MLAQVTLKGEAKLSIHGLALTGVNYTVAIDIVKKFFGRTENIIFSHIEELLNISVLKQLRVSVLRELNDKLQAHVRCLEDLGITGEQYGVLLCPVILSRLAPDLRLEWARESENYEGDLEWLLEFLMNEISRRERSQSVIKQESHSAVSDNESKGGPQQATTAALLHYQQCQNHVLCAVGEVILWTSLMTLQRSQSLSANYAKISWALFQVFK